MNLLGKLHNTLRESYDLEDIIEVERFLIKNGAMDFPRTQAGLYSAAQVSQDSIYTGYQNTWVRDTVHIAHARYCLGHIQEATEVVSSLLVFFTKQLPRFQAIIRGTADPDQIMQRPHIRFNGDNLEEITDKWAHAQNDALGYFLWFYSKISLERYASPSEEDWQLLAYFALYFKKIEYWQDEDNGHWEESRKVEASSIGAVVAAIAALARLMGTYGRELIATPDGDVDYVFLEELYDMGRRALNDILPYDCRQPGKERAVDGALSFLAYPLRIISADQTTRILENVHEYLQGNLGIKRYIGDSFWCANYKEMLPEEVRTTDFSDEISDRDSMLIKDQEAQWCVFDPIISVIYGTLYKSSHDQRHLKLQTAHLNRSLKQLILREGDPPRILCPELYYLERGRLVPNDVVPLLWTQANLSLALQEMKRALDPRH